MNRTWRVLTTLAALALVLPLLAGADPADTYSAGSSPATVQPSTSKHYTVTLANGSGSVNSANHATIGIPAGFTVDSAPLSASTTTSGGCTGASWAAVVDVGNSRIDVSAPAGPASELCPGGVLTVGFEATASASEGVYSWTTALLGTSGSFMLEGSQPTVAVDGSPPPAPSIGSHPPAVSSSPDASFGFNDSEGGVSFQCKLDDEPFAGCTSPKSYSGLGDGSHTFQVKARDAAGNESDASSFTWTIDTVAPTVTLADQPTDPSSDSTPSFSFSASEPSTFECELDTGGFASCTSPASFGPLPDGGHTFAVRATDAAGNTGPAIPAFGWTIDTVAPNVSLTATPTDPSSDSAPSFSFSADEASSFQCQRDGGGFAACTSPKSYSGLADGPHAFEVKARDAAGNESTATSFSWTIDSAPPPPPTIDSAPSDPSNTGSASFTFSDAEAGVAFLCQRDGGGFAACTSPKSYSALTDGAHTFEVKARDAAGNESAVASFGWTIDTVAPPAPTLTSNPTAVSASASASFGFTDSEASVGFQCRLDSDSFDACTSPKDYAALTDGSHTFRVRAIDAAGNSSAVSTFTWTIDTAAPPVPTIDAGPDNPSNTSNPSLTFSDAEAGVTFQCRRDDASFSGCTSPKGYSGLADGSHTFQVKARDAAGNESAAASLTWTIDTVPPGTTITSAPSPTTNLLSASFAFSANEAATFECRRDGEAFAPCASPTTYTGLAAGLHVFEVRATDTAGNTGPTVTLTWTVDTTPPPPPTIDEGTAPSRVTDATAATFVFSDLEPGVTFRCRRDGGAFGSCASPKEYSGLSDGSHTFDVTAWDAAGNESIAATWTWVVDTVKPVVTIASQPEDPTNKKTATFAFRSNKAGSTFQCKLDSAAFAECTSPTSYSGLADGPHTFQVKATDASGTGTPAVFTWTVDTVPPPAPAIAGGPPAATSATSVTFVFSDSEPGLGFECQRDAGAFAACTSPVTYTGLQNGSHTFAVRAVDVAGNTGAAATRSWTVDTVPPDTAVSSGPDAVSGSSSATFTFASSEGGSSFSCSIDGGAFAPCLSPQTYGGFGNGPHSFRVRATDAAGNTDTTPASYSWTVDLFGATRTDRTPPANVAHVVKGVGYRKLRLRWTKPTDADFARVQVLVTNDARGTPGSVVYNGAGTSYTDAKFRNGVYYRYLIISYDRAGNASKGVTVVVGPNALLATPRDGARVKRAPLLDWATVRSARFYNVQVYLGSKKVLSAWPRSSKLKLKKRWSYLGRTYTLKKGRYRWYVWPGFGRLTTARYGQLIGQSTFVVR